MVHHACGARNEEPLSADYADYTDGQKHRLNTSTNSASGSLLLCNLRNLRMILPSRDSLSYVALSFLLSENEWL